jgi:hypothetical protein
MTDTQARPFFTEALQCICRNALWQPLARHADFLGSARIMDGKCVGFLSRAHGILFHSTWIRTNGRIQEYRSIGCSEEPMLLDLLVTAIASAVIGWNLGNWLLPASWIAVVSLAAIKQVR